MNVDPNRLPPPARIPPGAAPSRIQQWTALLLSISLTAMAAAVIWVAVGQGTQTPRVDASDATEVVTPELVVTAVPSFPVELLVMARAVSTAFAPTATPLPPTPTYPAPPMSKSVICGPWVEIGTPCTMPPEPMPTATPLPDCPVTPLEECIWRGNLSVRSEVRE